jgi:hypothetical protein
VSSNQVIEPQELEFGDTGLDAPPSGDISGTVSWFGSQISVEGEIDASECRRRSVHGALAPVLDLRTLSILSSWPIGVAITLSPRDWRAQALRRSTGVALARSGNAYWRLARPPVTLTSIWLVASDLEQGMVELSKLPRLPGLGIQVDPAVEVTPFNLCWADWLNLTVSQGASVIQESRAPIQIQDPTSGALWHMAETVLSDLVLGSRPFVTPSACIDSKRKI